MNSVTNEDRESGSLKTEKLLMTIDDLADECQVSVPKMRRLIKKHNAPTVRLGYRTLRFKRAEIEKWLKKFRSQMNVS